LVGIAVGFEDVVGDQLPTAGHRGGVGGALQLGASVEQVAVVEAQRDHDEHEGQHEGGEQQDRAAAGGLGPRLATGRLWTGHDRAPSDR
jgi:hypothetical protein